MNLTGYFSKQGFEKVGEIPALALESWWDRDHRIEVQARDLGNYAILRGLKTYFAKGLSEEGEVWVRDLDQMLEWLEGHFPEVRISFNFFRDISESLALKRIREKGFRETGQNFDPQKTSARLSEATAAFQKKRHEIADNQALAQLDSLSSIKTPSLTALFRDNDAQLRREAAELAEEGKKLERDAAIQKALVAAYRNEASAVSLVFSVATPFHWAADGAEVDDAVAAVTKELSDLHRFQIRQKLSYGQLRVPVEESQDPGLDWLALWCGGYPSPKQLEKWGKSSPEVQQAIESRFLVVPGRDIVVNGAVKDQKKLVAPRLLSGFLERLPRIRVRPSHAGEPGVTGEWVGFVMDGEEVTHVPFRYPVHLKNGYVSGTTRAGKSFTARVLAENAMLNGARVLIIDPTRQWCGLTLPATNRDVLERLDALGIGRDRATGFPARLYLPGAGVELPSDIEELFGESCVVSLKDLDDAQRCQIVRDILRAVYAHMVNETDRLELLVGIEEAHSFLPGNVAGPEAEEAAAEISLLINRLAREKVKYGCSLLLVSQSLADFRNEGRIVREMCNSRFFMRATDRTELEFVAHCVSREAAETVKSLRPGHALVHSDTIPATRVCIRPPFSDVREPTDQEIASVGARPGGQAFGPASELTAQERSAWAIVKDYVRRFHKPMPALEFEAQAGVRGGARQRLVESLESKGVIQTVTVERRGRGRPSQGLVPAPSPKSGTR